MSHRAHRQFPVHDNAANKFRCKPTTQKSAASIWFSIQRCQPSGGKPLMYWSIRALQPICAQNGQTHPEQNPGARIPAVTDENPSHVSKPCSLYNGLDNTVYRQFCPANRRKSPVSPFTPNFPRPQPLPPQGVKGLRCVVTAL